MHFWFDLGVDGLRLDAVPYLVERDNTSCENLPETHAILKQLRNFVDSYYPDRILLAEANLYPSAVRDYFAAGNECHMAFHFPLMPRIFMAVHQENRESLTKVLCQTPPIPTSCQWALFLRNHDELTLEMVSPEDRDYMYKAYAPDKRMRINLGIRRRLAPLLEFSRLRLELVNCLLLSLPGTPIIYYGDEIGMGDNIFLADRNGVRTPMQWAADSNGGFSRAPLSELYCPANQDLISGFQSVNVESQLLNQSSLLNWMKDLISVRRKHKVFGRGSLEILYPDNEKVLAYIRRDQEEIVLVIANLSRYSQSAQLELASYQGLTPVELIGSGQFHSIEERPYQVTLAPYGFYWLSLKSWAKI